MHVTGTMGTSCGTRQPPKGAMIRVALTYRGLDALTRLFDRAAVQVPRVGRFAEADCPALRTTFLPDAI
jgi:hypothetical protein